MSLVSVLAGVFLHALVFSNFFVEEFLDSKGFKAVLDKKVLEDMYKKELWKYQKN